jgi:hypothetical protein
MRKNAHSTDNNDTHTEVAVAAMGVAFPFAVTSFSSLIKS